MPITFKNFSKMLKANKKLSKAIQKSYKDNVTKFMRDVVGYIKKMK